MHQSNSNRKKRECVPNLSLYTLKIFFSYILHFFLIFVETFRI